MSSFFIANHSLLLQLQIYVFIAEKLNISHCLMFPLLHVNTINHVKTHRNIFIGVVQRNVVNKVANLYIENNEALNYVNDKSSGFERSSLNFMIILVFFLFCAPNREAFLHHWSQSKNLKNLSTFKNRSLTLCNHTLDYCYQ